MTAILPQLSVRRGREAVEFYKAAFGAVEVFRIESPDGAVVSRLSVEGAEFWVVDVPDPVARVLYFSVLRLVLQVMQVERVRKLLPRRVGSTEVGAGGAAVGTSVGRAG